MNWRASACLLGFLTLVFVLVAATWEGDKLPVLLALANAQPEEAARPPETPAPREAPVTSENARVALIVLVLLSATATAVAATMILMGKSFQERVGPRLPG